MPYPRPELLSRQLPTTGSRIGTKFSFLGSSAKGLERFSTWLTFLINSSWNVPFLSGESRAKNASERLAPWGVVKK